MTIEENIFNRYKPDFKKLKQYGFKTKDKDLTLEKSFKNNEFKAIIKIMPEDKIQGTVIDAENNEEYLPFRVKSNQSAYANEVKSAYEELLINIRDNCFSKKYFIFDQSNRITDLIINQYGSTPEFLWEKFQGSGVFRNEKSKKWYVAILDVDRGKIQKGKKGLVEVILVKLHPENVEKLTKLPDYYPGYHMNKKYWICAILDDSLSDDEIMNLVKESYDLSIK